MAFGSGSVFSVAEVVSMMVVLLRVPLYGAGSTVVDTLVPVELSVDEYNPGVANNSVDSVAHLLRMSVV